MPRQRWRPAVRRFPVASPAAGADWQVRNDSGGGWLVRVVTATLTTDANVANREPALHATDGNQMWFHSSIQVAQTAASTVIYCAFPGSAASFTATHGRLIDWPTDGLWLPTGHTLEMHTQLLQAGDQWSAIHIDAIEYPEVLPEHLVPSLYLYTDAPGE